MAERITQASSRNHLFLILFLCLMSWRMCSGETGELNHFLKGGDRLMALIQAKEGEELIERRDADSLRADLACRVKRNVL
ncbi:hypothetical protein, partial [Klebsiella pneumoniae]|uniref:hypothetical protein n=1 Tax=Klebsiella pneumoniae TaxID=573 RepID=UPI0040557C65